MYKRTTLFLLLFISACSPQKNWIYREVSSKLPEFESSYLQLPPQNELTGIGVEILSCVTGTTAYLNVISRQIPPFQGNPAEAIVVFQIGDEKIPYKAHRMEGGQRLLLPHEATEKLIKVLSQDKTLKIYLDGYQTDVITPCANFLP